jgi:hypothetical protein
MLPPRPQEQTMPLDSAEILENTRKLAPKVAARAEEIAKLRRLPLDLVAGLEAAREPASALAVGEEPPVPHL